MPVSSLSSKLTRHSNATPSFSQHPLSFDSHRLQGWNGPGQKGWLHLPAHGQSLTLLIPSPCAQPPPHASARAYVPTGLCRNAPPEYTILPATSALRTPSLCSPRAGTQPASAYCRSKAIPLTLSCPKNANKQALSAKRATSWASEVWPRGPRKDRAQRGCTTGAWERGCPGAQTLIQPSIPLQPTRKPAPDQ